MSEKILFFKCEHCEKEYWVDEDYPTNFVNASTVWREQLERLHKKCDKEYKGELFFKCEFCGEEVYAYPDYLHDFPESSTHWYNTLKKQHLLCDSDICSGNCNECPEHTDDGFCNLLR